MSVQTFKRREDKFILDSRRYAPLRERLEEYMEYDSNCVNGCYTILNIYFDTPNNDVIRLSAEKPYYKEKLRLRSYGVPESDESPVFLELKRKIGGVVNKRRAALTYGEAKKYLADRSVPENAGYENRQVLSEIDRFRDINPVVPAAFISYGRIAMFGKDDKDLRLTIDDNIQARRDHLSLSEGCYGRQLLPEGEKLLEIKINGAIPLWLAKALSELEIYSESFSKIGTEYRTMLLGAYKELEITDGVSEFAS